MVDEKRKETTNGVEDIQIDKQVVDWGQGQTKGERTRVALFVQFAQSHEFAADFSIVYFASDSRNKYVLNYLFSLLTLQVEKYTRLLHPHFLQEAY